MSEESIISLKTTSFVNWPIIPNKEFIKINRDAVVAICFGYPAFNKNSIGLRNIPPPIPTIPEINPSTEPIIIDKKIGIFFNLKSSLLNDLLSINKKYQLWLKQ